MVLRLLLECFIFPKLYEISMGRVYCYKAPILWFSIILFIFILHLPCIPTFQMQYRVYTFCLLSYSFILFSPLIPLVSSQATESYSGAFAKYASNCNVKFCTLLYMYMCVCLQRVRSSNIKSGIACWIGDLYNIYL